MHIRICMTTLLQKKTSCNQKRECTVATGSIYSVYTVRILLRRGFAPLAAAGAAAFSTVVHSAG